MGNCCSGNPQDPNSLDPQTQRENMKQFEESAIQVQKVFRGHKARSQFEDKKQAKNQHGPSQTIAVSTNAWPDLEYIPQSVKNTIKQLGEFKIKSNLQDSKDGEFTELGPYKFIDKNNKYLFGSVYKGQWIKGLRWGKGKQIWPDGSYYVGQFINDMAYGKGRLIHADGDCYEGEWVEDKVTGYGKYYHTDGAYYEGQWLDDQQHGKGREVWKDKAEYEGDYVKGLKHGFGTFKWTDGSCYQGQFKDNNIHGRGTYQWSDGRKYEGEWQLNKMHGQGVFTWAYEGGQKYEGQYEYDLKHGYGVFYWDDGRVYQGNWKNGKQHGEGTFKNSNGEEITGFWEYGQRTQVDPNQEVKYEQKYISDQPDNMQQPQQPQEPYQTNAVTPQENVEIF